MSAHAGLVVKAELDGDLRRVRATLPADGGSEAAFEVIRTQVVVAFGLAKSASGLSLTYRDETGDLSTLTAETLQEALSSLNGSPLRLVISIATTREARCVGCSFAVTGITLSHCCRRCQKKPGCHGPRCLRRALQTAEQPADAGAASTATSSALQRCAGCAFAVTGVTPRHCCKRCETSPGSHGQRCLRRPSEGPAQQSPPPASAGDAAAAADSDGSMEESCKEGGWGDDQSDDDYQVLRVDAQQELSILVSRGLQSGHRSAEEFMAVASYAAWVEDTAFQIGNAAHEVRNSLRFWSSLVRPVPGHGRSESMAYFRRADNLSGKLETKMRRLVGRVRSKPQRKKQPARLLAKSQGLLDAVWANLSVLDAEPRAAQEQRSTIEELVTRQGALLRMLSEVAQQQYQEQSFQAPPGSRIVFSSWSDGDHSLVEQQMQKVASGHGLVAQDVIGLARLCCNSSHELQNLSVGQFQGPRTAVQRMMKSIDNVAGKCENAARAIMVLAHRWQINHKERPVARIAQRACFLMEASQQCQQKATTAFTADGAGSVPASTYELALARLQGLACLLLQAHLPTGPAR